METSSTSQGNIIVQVEGNKTPKHLRWNYELETQFLELLLTEDKLGNRVGGTFTSAAYRNILCELHNTCGTVLRKNHLRNKIRTLKHTYSEFKDAFRGMSGFSWNWQSKKFVAEDEVWESLIKDNPAATSLRHKTCQHWDIMNPLWSSNRAQGIETSTVRERSERIQQQINNESIDTTFTRRNKTYSSAIPGASEAQGTRTEGMDIPLPDASDSQASIGSYKGKLKRKANIEGILESVGKNLSTSLDEVSIAMVESAEIMANKLGASSERSKNLFNALQGLDFSKDYLLECYKYLNKHEEDANMFLGLPEEFKREILTTFITD